MATSADTGLPWYRRTARIVRTASKTSIDHPLPRGASTAMAFDPELPSGSPWIAGLQARNDAPAIISNSREIRDTSYQIPPPRRRCPDCRLLAAIQDEALDHEDPARTGRLACDRPEPPVAVLFVEAGRLKADRVQHDRAAPAPRHRPARAHAETVMNRPSWS